MQLSPDAYVSTTSRASPPVYTRVYRATGRYAHLREFLYVCGPQVWRFDVSSWLGTGSQDEYDTAAAMPLCPRCFAIREAQLPDPRLGAGHGQEMT